MPVKKKQFLAGYFLRDQQIQFYKIIKVSNQSTQILGMFPSLRCPSSILFHIFFQLHARSLARFVGRSAVFRPQQLGLTKLSTTFQARGLDPFGSNKAWISP